MTLLLADEVSDATTDLVVVYLPGLDIAQHALLGSDTPLAASASASAARIASLRTTSSRSTRCWPDAASREPGSS